MELFGRKVRAAIFDIDGTLIDSTNVWTRVDTEFFGSRGMKIPEGYVDSIAHIGLEQAAKFTKETYGIKESPKEIMEEWYRYSKKQYEEIIELKKNVKEYLQYLKNNNIKIAAATANSKDLYEPCLKRLGIYDFFDVIVDVDEVKCGKNDVTLYKETSKRIGEKPENTLVFEDISVGLKTAFENRYISIAVYDEDAAFENDLKKKY